MVGFLPRAIFPNHVRKSFFQNPKTEVDYDPERVENG